MELEWKSTSDFSYESAGVTRWAGQAGDDLDMRKVLYKNVHVAIPSTPLIVILWCKLSETLSAWTTSADASDGSTARDVKIENA